MTTITRLKPHIRQSLKDRIERDIRNIGCIYGTIGRALYNEPVERLIGRILESVEIVTAAPELLQALKLYIRLDNDRRAGCTIGAADWGECHEAGRAAIAKATGKEN